MRLIVEIEMDNAAFEDDPREEVEAVLLRMLRKIDLIEADSVKLRDSNGNTVGTAEVVED